MRSRLIPNFGSSPRLICPRLNGMLGRILIALVLLLVPVRVGAQEILVDLELVLAVDASSSIDAGEFRLQLDGIALAFRDKQVLSAILSGRTGQIAVAMVLWADASLPVDESDWFIIASEADAERFSNFVYRTRRRAIGGTGIGAGIAWAIRKFDRNGIVADRQVVDVSGDGKETPPREIAVTMATARAMALSRGVTINALAILNDDATLATWYANHVIAGPNSFVISVSGFESFARAMTRKLIREIEDRLRIGAVQPQRSPAGGGRAELDDRLHRLQRFHRQMTGDFVAGRHFEDRWRRDVAGAFYPVRAAGGERAALGRIGGRG